MMNRNMHSNIDKNMMDMGQQRYSNFMSQDSLNRKIMDQDATGHNMGRQDTMRHNMMHQDTMGRNIYNIMSNRGMTSDVSNMMDRDMTTNIRSHSMIGQDRHPQMMGRKMLGHQDLTPNMIYSNMMGQDMIDMSNNIILSNMMNGHKMTSKS